VYLLDERRGELRVEGAIGYPPRETPYVLKAGEGLVGLAITEQRPVVVDDVTSEPRYVQMVPGIRSAPPS
jgi:putative methionine-R-sulfoxide reductase with GAF domain